MRAHALAHNGDWIFFYAAYVCGDSGNSSVAMRQRPARSASMYGHSRFAATDSGKGQPKAGRSGQDKKLKPRLYNRVL
jgi:hypothetical protein